MLMRPRFAEDKIDLAKERQKAEIARRNDEPMSIAQREAMKVLFGPEHPLARTPEYDTIAAMTQRRHDRLPRRPTSIPTARTSSWSATSTPSR